MVGEPKGILFNVDRNPILKAIVRATVYDHFCAGESMEEVRERVEHLRSQGFDGVMVAPGHEMFLEESSEKEHDMDPCQKEVQAWQKLMAETLSMAGSGDYTGLKSVPRKMRVQPLRSSQLTDNA